VYKEFNEDIMVENYDLIVLQKDFLIFKKKLAKDLKIIRKSQQEFQDRLDKQSMILANNLYEVQKDVDICKGIIRQLREELETQIFNLNKRIRPLLLKES
jgi:orotate phosphoribosyltransferase-like protein